MIYLIGGAPRSGKTLLAQRLARKLGAGWISTDLLRDLVKVKIDEGPPVVWDASPQAIIAWADWFFPCLNRFVWGVNSLSDHYIIEGVHFLPIQAAELGDRFSIRALFIGCSTMSVDKLDQFPGRSQGYAALPSGIKEQIAADVPLWSRFIEREANKVGYPFLDMADDFERHVTRAERLLTSEGQLGRDNG